MRVGLWKTWHSSYIQCCLTFSAWFVLASKYTLFKNGSHKVHFFLIPIPTQMFFWKTTEIMVHLLQYLWLRQSVASNPSESAASKVWRSLVALLWKYATRPAEDLARSENQGLAPWRFGRFGWCRITTVTTVCSFIPGLLFIRLHFTVGFTCVFQLNGSPGIQK